MSANANTLQTLIENELAKVDDDRVVSHIRSLLVPPRPEQRPWEYGEAGQTYECWIVLANDRSGTAIAHCYEGFGPKNPWGLLFLEQEGERSSMGMDSSWYPTFMDAFFESGASTDLPIWRVVEGGSDDPKVLSEEMGWDEAWAMVDALKQSDPNRRIGVDHCIAYR